MYDGYHLTSWGQFIGIGVVPGGLYLEHPEQAI